MFSSYLHSNKIPNFSECDCLSLCISPKKRMEFLLFVSSSNSISISIFGSVFTLGLHSNLCTCVALKRSLSIDLSEFLYCWFKTNFIASNMVLFPTSFSPTRIFMCLLNSTSRLLNFLKPSICNDFM